MRRRHFLTISLAGLALAACGAPPASAPPPASANTARPAAAALSPTAAAKPAVQPVEGATDRLLVRDESGGSPRIIGVDAATGRSPFSLPDGMPTTGAAHWITLAPAHGSTTVQLFDARDGSAVQAINVPGEFRGGAVSHNDAWLLLVQPPSTGTPVRSSLALVDLTGGKVVEQAQLDGHYLADTVDDKGQWLFLIEQHPERKRDAYQVTLYDRATHAVKGPIVDKRSSDSIMSGHKVRHAWSKNGDWLFSLYLDPGGDGAFVHALNVPPAFAFCIDLPGATSQAAVLEQYALTLSTATDHAFAVNAALGLVSTFQAGGGTANSYHLTLPKLAQEVQSDPTKYRVRPNNNSVVSPDGATLYAGTDLGILKIPTKDPQLQPTDLLLAGRSIFSLGMGGSGKVLYALVDGATRRLVALDSTNGAQLGDLTGVVAQPTGIKQVTVG